MEEGFELRGNKLMGLQLSREPLTITFDHAVRTTSGVLWVMNGRRLANNTTTTEDAGYACIRVTLFDAHRRLGHMSAVYARNAGKNLGWQIPKGDMPPCEACAIGKAKSKKYGEGTDKPKFIGQLWYLDGTSIKDKGKGNNIGPFPTNNRAVMMVKALTQTGWLGYYETKSGFHNDFLARMNKFREEKKYTFKRI